MTAAETILWRDLRGGALEGLKFRQQVPIDRYVVDFLCVERKLHDATRDGELADARAAFSYSVGEGRGAPIWLQGAAKTGV